MSASKLQAVQEARPARGKATSPPPEAFHDAPAAEVIRVLEDFTSQWSAPEAVIRDNADLARRLRKELKQLPAWDDALRARTLAKKVAQHRFGLPFKCNFEISAVCPLQCEYCVLTKDSALARQRRKPLMEWSDFEATWRYMEAFTTEVEFTGGEPLLNPKLFAMIREMNRAGVYSQVTTNAQLLTEADVEELLDAQPTRILIAYDSSEARAYESTRRRGKLSRLNENIRRLSDCKRRSGNTQPEICLQMIVHRKNYMHVDRFWEEAEAMDVDAAAIKPVLIWPGRGEEYERAMIRNYLVLEHPVSYHKLDESGELVKLRQPGVCPNVQNVVIGSGTEVIPCWYILLDTHVAGYAADTPFPEIWYGAAYREYRRRMVEETVSPACPGCLGLNFDPALWQERSFRGEGHR